MVEHVTLKKFKEWIAAAEEAGAKDDTPVMVSTCGEYGVPSFVGIVSVQKHEFYGIRLEDDYAESKSKLGDAYLDPAFKAVVIE